jgi:hypothetical protein
MPNPTTRQLAVLAVGVLLAHLLGLAWLAQRATGPGNLALMAEPEFNRVLAPGSQPPPPAAHAPGALPPPTSTVGQVVQARTLAAPTAAARTPQAADTRRPPGRTAPRAQPAPPPTPSQPVADERPPEATASQTQPPADDLQAVVQPLPPADPTNAPNSEQKSPLTLDGIDKSAINEKPDNRAWLDTWPASTRLIYQLKGFFRGEFSGDARVQWQRNAERYQAQVDVSVALLLNMRMTSQGRITPNHLWPEAYEEERRGKKRGARFGDQLLQLDNGSTLPRPAQLQDAASQFVQLAQDFATGRRRLTVGESVKLSLGRPGGVDEWTYDVVAQDTLPTPLGNLTAFHLKPRPLDNPRGKVTVDMWFAPALQHLPARIKLTLNEDTWLDLTLTGVAQSP